jgi:hypothetical protein
MKTKINLIEKLYDDEQKPIKEHSETVQSVLQRIAEKDIKQYNSTNALLKEVTGEFSEKDLKVQDILKTIALGDVGDKEEKGDSDFDLYMDLRTETSEVTLNDDQVDRLKHKLKKLNISTLVRGQVKYILSGKHNPMKPQQNRQKPKP